MCASSARRAENLEPGAVTDAVVRVLFFASLRDAVGCPGLDVPVAAGLPLGALIERMRSQLSDAAAAALVAEDVRVAVNQEMVAASGAVVYPGDEVAFLPPVTGG